MKVSILYNFRDGPWGGANQFLKGLRNYLEKEGIYTDDPEKADVIMINQYPFNYENMYFKLYKLKRMRKKVVHRLDGAMILTRGLNHFYDKIQYYSNDLFTEGTIFQSQYVEECNKELGLKDNIHETLIFNAPDPEIFNRKGKKIRSEGKPVIVISSWSQGDRKGFKVYRWLDKNLDFDKYRMIYIGNLIDPFENIEDLGPKNSKDLSSELKRCDIYITASQNEACSNSLLEALHTGLPAIALRDGSHPELVKTGGELFDKPEEIPELLEKVLSNYDSYVNNIDVKKIDEIGSQYVDFFRKVSESDKMKKTSLFPFISFITYVYSKKLYLKARNVGYIVKNKILRRRIV